jgi:hypothetical protein
MAYTAKQERNGATGDDGSQNSAQPGPVPVVAPLVTQSQAAATTVMGGLIVGQDGGEGRVLMESPQGSGIGGHQVGAHGSMWAWDDGLAINDVEGGGSG